MKMMTCRQLGGPCDEKFRAETFEELIELSQKHGIEMEEKGDAEHIKLIKKIREELKNPGAMEEWFEKAEREFDALPED